MLHNSGNITHWPAQLAMHPPRSAAADDPWSPPKAVGRAPAPRPSGLTAAAGRAPRTPRARCKPGRQSHLRRGGGDLPLEGQARTTPPASQKKPAISGRRGDWIEPWAFSLARLFGWRRQFPEPFFRLRAARVRVLHAQMLSRCPELLRGESGLLSSRENLARGALAVR
jgi:hypothetical protein